MKKIEIGKEFAHDRISREAGERLREMIVAAVEATGKVLLDFDNLVIASTSFLDEGLAKLAEHGWSSERFERTIEISNIHPRDRALIEELFQKRLKGRKNR